MSMPTDFQLYQMMLERLCYDYTVYKTTSTVYIHFSEEPRDGMYVPRSESVLSFARVDGALKIVARRLEGQDAPELEMLLARAQNAVVH